MPVVIAKSVVQGAPINIADLLSQGNSIPPFQRDYVWQEKQVEALWDDLIAHYKLYSIDEELLAPEGYFLGAMVVIETDANTPHEVVDGQQRLASLSTIVSVFLDQLSRLPTGVSAKAGLEHRLTSMLGKFDYEWLPNLTFPEDDLKEFFLQSCLLKISQIDKQIYWDDPWCKSRLSRKQSPFYKIQTAISVGYKKIDAFLDEVPQELRAKRLISFITLITEGVIFLRIVAMSYQNAYAIFESLNNRGIPLSQADLIKNELLRTADSSERSQITDNWQNTRTIIDDIEILSMPDFVHYSYISRYSHAKARELFDKVKEIISSPAKAKTYSEELLQDADALEAVTESYSTAILRPETMEMLNDIKDILNIRHCYPFIIAAYRSHAGNPLTLHEHIKAVMSFAFRYMKIMEESLETFTVIIGEACKLVNANASITDIKTLFIKYAPNSAFEKSFSTASISNTKLAYFTVFYLEKIQLGGTVPVPHGFEQNLEHIMPKTPNTTHWPEALALKNSDAGQYKTYLWRIGNLLPLPATINKSIKNNSIALKIRSAAGSDYSSGHTLRSPLEVLTFLDVGKWTYKSIEDRQNYLATNFASLAWPL